jgi:hypothetical protein
MEIQRNASDYNQRRANDCELPQRRKIRIRGLFGEEEEEEKDLSDPQGSSL